MSSFFNEEMYKEIIMDHIKSPRNKDKDHEGYLEYTLKNPSCGDIVTTYISLEDETVKDITYNVEGCSICCSSASMMSEIFKGKTVEETKKIIEEFNKMMIGEEFNEEILESAISLKGVYNTPPRIKCATLGYKSYLEAIGENYE